MSNEITIRISREQLLQLKQTDYAMYQFIISAKDKERDYYETLDREKLKAECDLKYFNPEDLFSKQDLIDCCLKNGWLITPLKLHSSEPIKPFWPSEVKKTAATTVVGEGIADQFIINDFYKTKLCEPYRGKPQAFDGIQKLDEIEINKAQSLGVTEESLKKEMATLAEYIKLDNKREINGDNIAYNINSAINSINHTMLNKYILDLDHDESLEDLRKIQKELNRDKFVDDLNNAMKLVSESQVKQLTEQANSTFKFLYKGNLCELNNKYKDITHALIDNKDFYVDVRNLDEEQYVYLQEVFFELGVKRVLYGDFIMPKHISQTSILYRSGNIYSSDAPIDHTNALVITLPMDL